MNPDISRWAIGLQGYTSPFAVKTGHPKRNRGKRAKRGTGASKTRTERNKRMRLLMLDEMRFFC
jgi:hypothetical protein